MSGREAEALSRRELLLKAAAAAGGMAALGVLPSGATAGAGARDAFTGTLHVLGIGYDQFDPIRKQAEKDLGFKIAFAIGSSDAIAEQAIAKPGSFDVLSSFYFSYD